MPACVICLQTTRGYSWKCKKCKKYGHATCMTKWEEAQRANFATEITCPHCRGVLKKTKYHPNFRQTSQHTPNIFDPPQMVSVTPMSDHQFDLALAALYDGLDYWERQHQERMRQRPPTPPGWGDWGNTNQLPPECPDGRGGPPREYSGY